MATPWNYFKKFDRISDQYLPGYGEGDNMATQIVTAVNKLVYKWFNDGDVYDNTYQLDGWCNDLSSYANWLYKYCEESQDILDRIYNCDENSYSDLLADLADRMLDAESLSAYATADKQGSVYECDGPFMCSEDADYYDEYEYDDDYDDYDDEYADDEEFYD